MGTPGKLFILTCLGIICLQTIEAVKVGCYKEDRRNRKFNISPGGYKPASLTPNICAGNCAYYKHSHLAIAQGKYCFCASSPDLNGADKDDSKCPLTCTDGSECGGRDYVSVYEVGGFIQDLSFSVSERVVKVKQAVTFTISVTSDLEVNYQFDYGDGAGRTEKNGTDIYSKSFEKPGEYEIILLATDIGGSSQEMRATTSVLVEEPVGAVELLCPESWVTFSELECNATVSAGTGMQATVDFKDGPASTFNIADPPRFFAGPGIPDKGTETGGEAGVIIMPASEFKQTGTLVALELHANSNGDLKVLVLRPSCGGCYSYQDNVCQGGACADPDLYQCGVDRFCPSAAVCTTNSCNPATRYSAANPQVTSYEVVANIAVSTVTVGYNYIDPSPEKVTVQKGDILGYVSGVAVLSERDPTTPGEGDFTYTGGGTQNVGDVLTGYSYCAGGKRHLLKGVITQPVLLRLRHEYKTNQVFSPSIEVENKYITAPKQSDTTSVTIGDGIDYIILQAAGCFETTQTVQVDITPHKGDGVTYSWDWGDGPGETDLTSLTNTHLYSASGRYNVTVTGKNLLSEKSNVTEICVEDAITSVSVSSLASETNKVADFTITLSGSDFTCDWDFGDTESSQTNSADTPSGALVPHTYTSPGIYTVDVNCHNSVSTKSFQLSHVVEDPITGLTLLTIGALKGEDFELRWSITTGTDPTFTVSIGTKNPTSVYDPGSKIGTTPPINDIDFTGTELVYIQATNKVSNVSLTANFSIEVKIHDVIFLCSKDTIPVQDTVDFTVKIGGGSGVEVLIDYEDGGETDTYSIQSGETWINGFDYEVSHIFKTGGSKTVRLTVSNGVDLPITESCQIDVIAQIADMDLISNSPVTFSPPGKVEIHFEQKNGTAPAGASVTLDWKDGSVPETYPFDLAETYFHTYVADGNYRVRAEISNGLSQLVLFGDVKVVEPVEEFKVVTDPPHASVGVDVKITAVMKRGCESVDILSWDIEDKAPFTTAQDSACPFGETSVPERFSHVKTYSIKVRADTPLGSTEAEYIIHNQIPVTEALFDVTVTGPSIWTGVSVTKTFSVDKPDRLAPLPTDAEIVLDYGEGTVETRRLTPVLPEIFTFSYSAPGHYMAKVTIKNLASSVVYPRETGVYEPITDMAVNVLYTPFPPVNSAAREGFGATKNVFPMENAVEFHVSKTTGTVVKYIMEATGPGTTTESSESTESPLKFNFSKEGMYAVTIKAWNSEEEVAKVVNVEVISSSLGLSISDGITTASGENKTFQVSLDSIGTDSCLVIDFGDGNLESRGDPSFCNPPTGYPFARYAGNFGLNNKVYHIYWQIGTYTIYATSFNFLSETEASLTFPVLYVVCQSPAIDIEDRAPLFYKPRAVKRSKIFRVIGTTDLNCTKTLENTKLWQVWLVDRRDGAVISEVDVSFLHSSKKAELAVPARFLPYGLYKIRYTVSMDQDAFPASTDFTGYAETYVDVEMTDLIAIMVKGGMSTIKIAKDATLTLSPGDYSIDPDLEDGVPQTFDSYTWFCMKDDDRGYPILPDGSYNTSFPAYPLPDPSVYAEDHGGCFRQGPGPIGFFTKTIAINALQFDVNRTYEFMVIITKDTRSATAKINVQITENAVPSVVIKCKTADLCRQVVEGQKVNPSARLALSGLCDSGCPPHMNYRWSGYSYDYRWPYKPIADFEQFTSGVDSPEIAINTSLFTNFSDVPSFRIHLEVWEDGGEKGLSQIIILVNTLPANGTCTLSGNSGEVLSSNTVLECKDWTDDEEITYYQFFVKFKDEHIERQLVFGSNPKVSVQLPQGPDWDDYYMEVFVRIYDSNNAFTLFPIGRTRVRPSSSMDLGEWVERLVSGQDDTIKNAAARAHLLESCYTFQSLGSALNSASKGSVSEYVDAVVSAQKTPTGFGPDRVNKSQEKSVSEEQEKQAKIDKDERAQLRAQMIAGIKKVTTSNVASIALKASTLTALGAYPDELTRQAQVDMMDVLVDCATALDTQTEVTTKEELIAAGTNILAGAGVLLVASKYHYDDPLLSDLAKADDQVFYDTNLESEDDPIESLDPEEGRFELTLGTNKGLQKKTADDVVGKIVDGIKEVSKAVGKYLVPGEEAVEIVTDQLALSLEKNRASDLVNREVDNGFGGSVVFPDWCSLLNKPNCSTDEIINLEVISTPSVPFGLTENAVNLSSSNAIEINFIQEDGSHVNIAGSKRPIAIVIPREPALNKDIELFTEPEIITSRKWEYLYYHKSAVETKDSSIHVEIDSADRSVQYLAFVRFNKFPNVTKREWDFVQQIPKSMAAAGSWTPNDGTPDPYSLFIPNNLVPADWTGTFYVGLRQLLPSEYDTYASDSDVDPSKWKGGENTFTGNYSMKIYTSKCLYFSEDSKDWMSDGCTVGAMTTLSQQQCFCTHLTAFAGGLIVAPNAIDWDYVFANADFLKNPTIYCTQIAVFVLYIIACIWARRKDKKDIQEVGITPLPDNEAQDKYYYEIVAQTGMRSGAGTDSKVHFILSGEYEETDVRPLIDPKRKVFRRGGTDGFLLAVPRPLGPLNFVRIWHDNSGKGKFGSWYLKYFLVRDLQTGEKFYFICNKWFAVEEGDGQVDRVCPVAGPEQMMQFSHQFSQKTRRNLSDGHLWFSVVARPPRSRFTRVQRVSCCLSLLFLTMMANAMYYERVPDASGTNSFTFGPFALTPAQLYIGVITNLIVFPVSFVIVTLFRKSRPRKKRPSRIKEAIQKSGVKLSDINPEMGSKWSLKQKEELNLPDRNNPELRDEPTPRPQTAVSTISNYRSETAMSGRISNSFYNQQKQRRDRVKTKRMVPWWCTIIAWILLWASVLVSVAIVTAYGIQFGDYKSKQWITSMLVAFVMSIFITQPIKVFLTAVVLSLIIRNPGEDDDEGDEDEEDPALGTDEEYMYQPHALQGYSRPRKVAYKPPDPSTLERARVQRLKEIQMWNVVREIVFYAFFLWILMVISYGNRDPNSYLYKYSLERNFIGNNVTSFDFNQVHNTQNFWNWTLRSLVPSIRAHRYYNDDPPLYLRGYINDKVSRIMGYATMRQLRITKGTCRMEEAFTDIIESCNGDYQLWNEDKDSYKTGWQSLNGSESASDLPSHYVYRSASSLNGYPYWGRLSVYGGGGYVVELRESAKVLSAKMNILESEGWIDKYTRAVFVEFTVYNPGVNLFAVATLLAEWHPSAGVVASYRFEPVRLFSYMESAALFQIICELAFLFFIIFFIYREVRSIIREKGKYLRNFWNLVEISIIGMSIAGIVIYFYRLVVSNQLTNIFKESHGNDYMKFQYVGYWNEILSYMIGWLVFLATLKFLKLLRFNRRMSLLAATLRNGWKSMFHFGIIFTIVFLAFIQLFYLVYHTNIYTFANFINSMEAGFLMMMGKFDIYSMMMMEPLITPIFFFCFVLTVTFILVNMFVSILNESFSNVKHDISKQSNDYEIVDFMLGRFKQWTGLGGVAAQTGKTNDLMLNNLKSGDGKPPVEHFPDKVDELLNTISKAYFDQDNLENVLGPKTDADRMAMKNLLKQHADANKQQPLNRTPTDKVSNYDRNDSQYHRF